MKKIALLFLLMTSFAASGQHQFISGYVVTITGDTIHGQIADRDWKINPVQINFRKGENTGGVDYNVSQLKSFYLATRNQLFHSVTVILDQSPASAAELTEDNSNLKVEKGVFATVLFESTVTLYLIFDFKNHFLVKRGNDRVQELALQRKVIRNSSGSGVQTLELYRGQLSTLLSDCPSLSGKIANVNYTRTSLLNLFKEYGNCTGQNSKFVETKKPAQNDFGMIAGASLTTHSFGGEDAGHLGRSSYNPLISPSIGFFFNHTFPKNFGMYSWYNEVNFKSFYAKSELTERQLNYDITYRNHSKFAMLRYLTGIKIQFTQGQRRPFISAGLSGSVALKKEFYTDIDRVVVTSGEPGPSTQEKYDARGFEFGFWLGAGIPLNQKLNLEVRAEKPQGYSSAVGFQAKVAHYSALLSYKLSK